LRLLWRPWSFDVVLDKFDLCFNLLCFFDVRIDIHYGVFRLDDLCVEELLCICNLLSDGLAELFKVGARGLQLQAFDALKLHEVIPDCAQALIVLLQLQHGLA